MGIKERAEERKKRIVAHLAANFKEAEEWDLAFWQSLSPEERLSALPAIRIPSNRVPTHPGEMLLEEFLKPVGLSQRELADAIRVPHQRVNEIINGRRRMTPSTALRLAKFFGVSPDFWMNLQLRWDLYFAQRSEADALKSIKPLPVQHNLA